MDKSVVKQATGWRAIFPVIIASPDVFFGLVLFVFGGVAAGWFFIGSGALLGLLPLLGLIFCWFASKRKNK